VAQAAGLAEGLPRRESRSGVDAEHLGGRLLVRRARAFEAEDARVVVVEAGQDDQRVAAIAEEAVQVLEGRRRVTAVDGVGQLPRGDAPGLAEEGADVVLADVGALAVGGGQQLEEGGQAADVLAEMGGEKVGGTSVELDRRGLELVAQPGLAGLPA